MLLLIDVLALDRFLAEEVVEPVDEAAAEGRFLAVDCMAGRLRALLFFEVRFIDVRLFVVALVFTGLFFVSAAFSWRAS